MYGPIVAASWLCLRRSIAGARTFLIDAAQAYVDLESFGVLAGIQYVERRIDPLSGREHARDGLAQIFRGLEIAGADAAAPKRLASVTRSSG